MSYSALLTILVSMVSATGLALQQKALHEAETAAAFESLEKGDLDGAIRHADRCIDEFRGAATRLQRRLVGEGVQVPKGEVSDEQRAAIFQNGPLNDVASSYFVKGLAHLRKGEAEEAVKALVATQELSQARCYDARGWFWSPAEAAVEALVNPANLNKAPHEALAAKAWEAFNNQDYRRAIELADTCLRAFYPSAVEAQQKLIRDGVKAPPIGAVSEDVRVRVLANGLINDVSACAFIKGRSAEKLGDREAAMRAFQDALRLDFGRCWDPQGWFWSPAEGASDRLAGLR